MELDAADRAIEVDVKVWNEDVDVDVKVGNEDVEVDVKVGNEDVEVDAKVWNEDVEGVSAAAAVLMEELIAVERVLEVEL